MKKRLKKPELAPTAILVANAIASSLRNGSPWTEGVHAFVGPDTHLIVVVAVMGADLSAAQRAFDSVSEAAYAQSGLLAAATVLDPWKAKPCAAEPETADKPQRSAPGVAGAD
jgi:hypothetical protein